MEQKQRKNEFEQFDVEIYKVNSVTGQNQFIYFDYGLDKLFRETNLLNIYDMLKQKDIIKFAKFVNAENGIVEKYLNNKDLDTLEIEDHLLTEQKQYYKVFVRKVLLYKQNVDGYTFKPLYKRIIRENNKVCFNLYRPLHNFNGLKLDIKAKFPCCEFLMKNLLQEGYEHFLDFLAWKLQKPCEIVSNHWIIQDDGGTGKTEILGDFILDKLFNVSIIGQDELHSPFTSYMENTTIVIAEEIEGYSDEKKIKMLTGAKFIMINDKFKSVFKIRNYNNWIIFSNDIRPLKISINDRRWNVVGGGKRLAPASDGDWSKTLFGSKAGNEVFFLKFHKNIDEEIKCLYKYLLARPVNRVQVQQTLNTKHKQQLEEMNYTSEHEFFNEIKDIGIENVIKEYYSKNVDYFINECIMKVEVGENEGYWIRISEFYDLYKDYVNKCNLKPLSKNHLVRRLKKVKGFKDMFGESKVISHDGKKFQAIKIHTYKDENKELI